MTVIKSKIPTQQMRRKNLEAIKYRLPQDSPSSHVQFRSRGFLINVRFLQALLCFDHLENGADKKRIYEKGVEEEDRVECLLYKSCWKRSNQSADSQKAPDAKCRRHGKKFWKCWSFKQEIRCSPAAPLLWHIQPHKLTRKFILKMFIWTTIV